MSERTDTPNYAYVLSFAAGAFLAFLIPDRPGPVPHAGGVVGAMIRFELNYQNVIMTIGLLWLLYWLVMRKLRGQQAVVMYGALGFVVFRLALVLRATLPH